MLHTRASRAGFLIAGVAPILIATAVFTGAPASAQNAAACAELQSQIRQLDSSIANMRSSTALGSPGASPGSDQAGLLATQRQTLVNTYNSYCLGGSSSGGGGGGGNYFGGGVATDPDIAAVQLGIGLLGMFIDAAADADRRAREERAAREAAEAIARAQREAEEARLAAERAEAERVARLADNRLRQTISSPFAAGGNAPLIQRSDNPFVQPPSLDCLPGAEFDAAWSSPGSAGISTQPRCTPEQEALVLQRRAAVATPALVQPNVGNTSQIQTLGAANPFAQPPPVAPANALVPIAETPGPVDATAGQSNAAAEGASRAPRQRLPEGANPYIAPQVETASGTLVSPYEREILNDIARPVMEDWVRRGYSATGCPGAERHAANLTNYCSIEPPWWRSGFEAMGVGEYTPARCEEIVRARTTHTPWCSMHFRRQLNQSRDAIAEAVREARCEEGREDPLNCDDDPDNDVVADE
jgi:hypothetical protein